MFLIKKKKKKKIKTILSVKSLHPHVNEIPIPFSCHWRIKCEHTIYVQSYSFIIYNIKYNKRNLEFTFHFKCFKIILIIFLKQVRKELYISVTYNIS